MARRALLAKLNQQASSIDPEQLADGLERLNDIIDNAAAIASVLKSARRGLDKIEGGYEQLSGDARAIICELEQELLHSPARATPRLENPDTLSAVRIGWPSQKLSNHSDTNPFHSGRSSQSAP